MSVVIIGGNECMERRYCELCRKYGCKAKVFCKPCAGMGNRIGTPDMIILFTHTVSHKMVQCMLTNVDKGIRIVRSHTSSLASLQSILEGAPCAD
jgi:hypothetical protein